MSSAPARIETALARVIDPTLEPVQSGTSAAEVARILASYNLVSVPVVDENHRLVGVVTIDDVLDYLLPDDWRSTNDETPVSTSTATIPVRRTSRGTR